MRYTNKLGLEEAIVEAITNSGYTRGQSDITVTELIDPPRLVALKHKHEAEITEDVSDLIFTLQGNSIHAILEAAGKKLGDKGCIVEERFYLQESGWKLGGKIDVYYPKLGLLQDYKVTSVYAVKNGPKEEYVKQLNVCAELLRQAGHEIKLLQIVAILRDWSKLEAARDENYPAHQVKVLDIPLVDRTEVQAYIKEKILEHKKAQAGDLPLCSKEERWAKPDTYAVKKKGAARATKLFETEVAAKIFLDTLDNKHYIEFRPGESVRCKFYCPVRSFCSQNQNNIRSLQTKGDPNNE